MRESRTASLPVTVINHDAPQAGAGTVAVQERTGGQPVAAGGVREKPGGTPAAAPGRVEQRGAEPSVPGPHRPEPERPAGNPDAIIAALEEAFSGDTVFVAAQDGTASDGKPPSPLGAPVPPAEPPARQPGMGNDGPTPPDRPGFDAEGESREPRKINMDMLNTLIEKRAVNATHHPDQDLIVLDYREAIMRERATEDELPLAEMCRGLIVNSSGEIVAQPFSRLHDIGPNDELPQGPFTVTEKVDGSLGITYFVDGQPRIATRRAFTDQRGRIDKANTMLQDYAQQYQFDPNITYLWEIIDPENPQVVNYGDEARLVLLGMKDTATGNDIPLPDPTEVDLPFEVVRQIPGLQTMEQLRTAVEQPDIEGFVVKMTDTGELYRIKSEEFEWRLQWREDASHDRRAIRVWDHLVHGGSQEDLLARVPFADRVETARVLADFQEKFTALEARVRNGEVTSDRIKARMDADLPYAQQIWERLRPAPVSEGRRRRERERKKRREVERFAGLFVEGDEQNQRELAGSISEIVASGTDVKSALDTILRDHPTHAHELARIMNEQLVDQLSLQVNFNSLVWMRTNLPSEVDTNAIDAVLHEYLTEGIADVSPEQVFTLFQPQIDEIQAAINQDLPEIPHLVGTSSTGSLICWLEDPTDPRPPAQRDRILTYFIPRGDDGTIRAQEQGRQEALSIAASIQDPVVRESMEQMIGTNNQTGQVITRIARAPHIDILNAEERRAVTSEQLQEALRTIEVMVENGIAPTSLNTSRLVDRQTGRILFKDYLPLGQSDLANDSSPQSIARIFGSLTRQFMENPRHNRDITLAGENVLKRGAGILRDHFLYREPRIATAAEDLPRAYIQAVYDYAKPANEGLTYDAFIASRLHDLALSRYVGSVNSGLAHLELAQMAYEDIVYEQTADSNKVLKTDDNGYNMLWEHENFLQARLALAFMPISEIRIRHEELTTEARTVLNQNLAEVLNDMLPLDRNDVPQHVQRHFYGFTNEVVGLTLLSRPSENADTSIALPVSEVRRVYEGPDASVLFSDERGNHEYDVDWKLEQQSGAGNVSVGSICLSLLNQTPELRQAFGSRNLTTRDAIWYVADLLRNEGLHSRDNTQGRELTDREKTFLDRAQARVWERIAATAQGGNNITDLRQKARF